MNLDIGMSARSTSLADLMKFDPCFGEANPYPSHPAQYRAYHGSRAWLFNPYSGSRRHPCDVGTDPFGVLCVDAAAMNTARAANTSAGGGISDTPRVVNAVDLPADTPDNKAGLRGNYTVDYDAVSEAHSRLMRGLYEWQNAGGSVDEVADAVRQMAEACNAPVSNSEQK